MNKIIYQKGLWSIILGIVLLLFSLQVFSQTASNISNIDFKKTLSFDRINKHDFIYLNNKNTDSFVVTFYINQGKQSYPEYNVLLLCLQMYIAEFSNKETYIYVEGDDAWTQIRIKGIQNELDETLLTLNNIFYQNPINEETWEKLKKRVLEYRNNLKSTPVIITQAFIDYARYGTQNPFNHNISNEAFTKWTLQDFNRHLQALVSHQHIVTYYGKDFNDFKKSLQQFYKPIQKKYSRKKTTTSPFTTTSINQNRVFYTHIEDPTTLTITWVKNNATVTREDVLINEYFNAYYNFYIYNSIRFLFDFEDFQSQVSLTIPNTTDKIPLYTYNCLQVPTQGLIIDSLIAQNLHLINNGQIDAQLLETSKRRILEDYNKLDISNEIILDYYMYLNKMGFQEDLKVEINNYIQALTPTQFDKYFYQQVSYKPYNMCVIGSPDYIKKETLQRYGVTKFVSLEELFGY